MNAKLIYISYNLPIEDKGITMIPLHLGEQQP